MAKVMLNQDSILNFPKGPHILSIIHLKYQSWISVTLLNFKMVMLRRHQPISLQYGHVVTSPANQISSYKVYIEIQELYFK